MACIYFEPDAKPSPKELHDNAFFVKLDAQDQIKRLKRSITKSSVDWWSKQCDNVKNMSFYPSPGDIKLEDGLEEMRIWSKRYADSTKSWVWARGNLDQLVLDDAEEQLEVKPIFQYNRWRDVRTAIDFLYETDAGYCDVNYPGFNPEINITKHNPIDDCIYDVMMLIYGVKTST